MKYEVLCILRCLDTNKTTYYPWPRGLLRSFFYLQIFVSNLSQFLSSLLQNPFQFLQFPSPSPKLKLNHFSRNYKIHCFCEACRVYSTHSHTFFVVRAWYWKYWRKYGQDCLLFCTALEMRVKACCHSRITLQLLYPSCPVFNIFEKAESRKWYIHVLLGENQLQTS